MARRAALQLNEQQWLAIKGRYGLENITKEQFNTSLRDRRRVTRISKQLEKSIDDSGITLNNYRTVVRSVREAALQGEIAKTFEAAAFGDQLSVKQAQRNIARFKKGLERMKEYDAEYVYAYKDGGVRYFKFDVEEGTVTISTISRTSDAAPFEKTYNIKEWPGLDTVLGMARTEVLQRVTTEVSQILFDEDEE